MNAFFIAQMKVKSTEKLQTYSQLAGPTISEFGGELVKRGKATKQLAGENAYSVVGIVAFPDMAALQSWFNSDQYQQLIPLRDEAVEMVLTAFEGL